MTHRRNAAWCCLPVLCTTISLILLSYSASAVVINEIHYDNAGTDSGEAIEVAGPEGTDLTGWSIVLYNGSNGTEYNTTDLSGDSKGKLEGHLKSDDFFGVANYPTAKFKITKVKAGSEKGVYEVHGKMTIKETTQDISFPAHVKLDGDKAVAKATLSVNRADFDVRYGSGRFFDNLGDNTIKDEFTLEVKIISSPAS